MHSARVYHLTPMFPYDSNLLASVQTIPQTIPDVVQTLENIEAICEDGDG